ncbi:prolyl oligopeptidase family serine peptidase [Amycolatopsis sp. NPDC098790]|uniref:S9 family peptidase n=1 Tax=Amycolatopsis sp. NPDC098790 TaxID=3363939 RepID=UPI0037FEEE03
MRSFPMANEVRGTAAWTEVEDYFQRTMGPAFGRIGAAADATQSPDGARVAFTGTIRESLEQPPRTSICVADSVGGVSTLTSGPNDRFARWSPDGGCLAFLSTHGDGGTHQAWYLEDGQPAPVAAPVAPGTVESIAWSPFGNRLLLSVAELGADRGSSSGSGSVTGTTSTADWQPTVDTGTQEGGWRSLHVVDRTSGQLHRVSPDGLNVWQASWLGESALLAVVSPGPGEELWYTATVVRIDLDSGDVTELVKPEAQLGLVAGAPSGERAAYIEAICSDRDVAAGELFVLDVASNRAFAVATEGADVTWIGWRDDTTLLWAGLSGLTTVVGRTDPVTGESSVLWRSETDSFGNWYPFCAPAADGVVTVLDSYSRPPEIVVIQEDGTIRSVASFEHPGTAHARDVGGTLRPYRWTAPDGLELEGLLITPDGPGPFPLIMHVHGGPVWAYRTRWEPMDYYIRFFAAHGFAVFCPNMRGSGGRGRDFAARIVGDMGGGEVQDFLSGVEALVAEGIADPDRLAVVGRSYGGYISAWLPTQTDLFAAAVPIAEVSDFRLQHWTSNIPHFDALFLDSDPADPAGKHATRSPISLTHRVNTPMLHIAGGLDLCTPASQAVVFHRALLAAGKTSECAVYPREGHGVRGFPAVIDQLTRVLGFLRKHCRVSA